MEKINRKPFEGVVNILQFNWHFFLIGFLSLILLITGVLTYHIFFHPIIWAIIILGFIALTFPIIISYYVYDLSGLYKLNWLNTYNIQSKDRIANINAGFDETSYSIQQKFKVAHLSVFDFYNAEKHTEVSIERARKKYSIFPNTLKLELHEQPLTSAPFDYIFVIFAAHEIRNPSERIAFFDCLKKSLANNGKIILVEHLRDLPNFIAYTIGAFHFYSKKSWRHIFSSVNLVVENESKLTPFISVFTLKNNGNPY